MTKTDTTANTKNALIEGLFSAGAHFGFVKSRRHPSAKPFIYGMKNKIEIIDLEKTKDALHRALEFIEQLGSKNAMILFVSGKNEAKKAILEGASKINMPYVAGRFIGGTITNFPEIRKRVDKLENLTKQREKGELSKYTKKERLLIDREIARLEQFFSGLIPMKGLPQALFVVDARHESTAVREAKRKNIPVIALCGTDNDLSQVDYPILANDSSKTSIQFFLEQITDAYKRGQLKTSL